MVAVDGAEPARGRKDVRVARCLKKLFSARDVEDPSAVYARDDVALVVGEASRAEAGELPRTNGLERARVDDDDLGRAAERVQGGDHEARAIPARDHAEKEAGHAEHVGVGERDRIALCDHVPTDVKIPLPVWRDAPRALEGNPEALRTLVTAGTRHREALRTLVSADRGHPDVLRTLVSAGTGHPDVLRTLVSVGTEHPDVLRTLVSGGKGGLEAIGTLVSGGKGRLEAIGTVVSAGKARSEPLRTRVSLGDERF